MFYRYPSIVGLSAATRTSSTAASMWKQKTYNSLLEIEYIVGKVNLARPRGTLARYADTFLQQWANVTDDNSCLLLHNYSLQRGHKRGPTHLVRAITRCAHGSDNTSDTHRHHPLLEKMRAVDLAKVFIKTKQRIPWFEAVIHVLRSVFIPEELVTLPTCYRCRLYKSEPCLRTLIATMSFCMPYATNTATFSHMLPKRKTEDSVK